MTDKTFSYRGYFGSIEVSIEDNCLHGKLLFVNDLVTYEADSPAGLEPAFQEAVDYYLEKCARDGMTPDKPFSGTFNVRTSPEQHRALAIVAANKGTSLNDIVRECFDAYFAKESDDLIPLDFPISLSSTKRRA